MPTIAAPKSQLCTQSQIEEEVYKNLCAEWKQPPMYHRKQWEHIYISQVLRRYSMLQAGKVGIGYGVGREPLPAFFASKGVDVLATDMPNGDGGGWSRIGQHAAHLDHLRHDEICSREVLEEHVTLAGVDMNNIPHHLMQAQFDFVWSACSLDHLGSLQKGIDFIWMSLEGLKSGGIGVYTTEYNLDSDDKTIEAGGTVIYRQRDLLAFAEELNRAGYEIAPFDFDRGSLPYDLYVDTPPYQQSPHLRLSFRGFAITSIGLIIRKPFKMTVVHPSVVG